MNRTARILVTVVVAVLAIIVASWIVDAALHALWFVLRGLLVLGVAAVILVLGWIWTRRSVR